MDKCAFLKTAIEVLKYDDGFKKIQKRENLIKLLSRSSVNFLPQWGFVGAGVSNQRWEIVEIRCPVPCGLAAWRNGEKAPGYINVRRDIHEKTCLQSLLPSADAPGLLPGLCRSAGAGEAGELPGAAGPSGGGAADQPRPHPGAAAPAGHLHHRHHPPKEDHPAGVLPRTGNGSGKGDGLDHRSPSMGRLAPALLSYLPLPLRP